MTKRLRIPAMVDPHVHLRGMEWSHKGDFLTETKAAVAGGYWAVLDMPNTPPHTIDEAALDHKLKTIDSQAVSDWGVYFGASAERNWDAYLRVFDRVCGLKMFNNDTTGHLLVEDTATRDGHYAHWPDGKVFANHAEGKTVAEIIKLARQYNRQTHIVHVSTAYELDLIRDAKADGVPITCGVCPHHLWLTVEDVERLGNRARMKPGLKPQTDQDALWQGIADGTIDVIESDHAPHTLHEKARIHAPYGVPGLETTLPLMLTAVHNGWLTVDRVIELVSENPRRIFGLDAPDDTYTLVDLDAAYTIRGETLQTHVGWSPFEGMHVQGRVLETWIRGEKVYDGENVLVEPGFGANCYG